MLTLSYKAPITCMLVFKHHCHRTPEISGLTPEISNPCLWLNHKMTLFLHSYSSIMWRLPRNLFSLGTSSQTCQWVRPQLLTSLSVLNLFCTDRGWITFFPGRWDCLSSLLLSLLTGVLTTSSFSIKYPLGRSLSQSVSLKLWPAPGWRGKAQVTGMSYTLMLWGWIH